jgi:predicted metal-dependent peptidase
MQLDPDTAQLVSACLSRLCTRNPFFGTLALFARVQASESLATAATDGRDVFINPAFFGKLSTPEQDGVLLHEVLHAALMHVSRRGGRDPQIWNIAADIVVNGMIRSSGQTLPAGHIRDPRLETLSTEEVYEHLLKQARKPSLAAPDLLERAPVDSAPASADGLTAQERQRALETYWRNAAQQAREAEGSVMQGTAPAALQRELQSLNATQLDWRSYLWRYLTPTPTDFSSFDRRFVGQGMYLDTLAGESVRVFVAVDTSGSVNSAQLRSFLSEVQGILQAYPHLRCDLYYADADVHGPYALTPNARLPTPVGGGGTDFRPFFERIAANSDPWTPGLSVYLTDGYGRFPADPPQIPVLWVVTPGGLEVSKFPFGEVVQLSR